MILVRFRGLHIDVGVASGGDDDPAVGRKPNGGSVSGVSTVGAQNVQRAYDAAVSGDIEPLVALLSREVDWTGPERGRWVWRKAPA
jgi:hypothetical protein